MLFKKTNFQLRMRISEDNVKPTILKILIAKFIVFYLPSSENVNCSNEGTRKESALFEWFIFLHLWLNQPASALKGKIERSKTYKCRYICHSN